MGWPHCTRSFANSRETLVAHLAAPTQIAGSASRPVFSVVESDLQAPALLADRFSLGTKTSLNRVTEFSMPRRPMNWLRCSTTTPSSS